MRSTTPRLRYPASAPPLNPGSTYAFHVITYSDPDLSDPSPRSVSPFHVAPIDWSDTSWIGSDDDNLYRADFHVDLAASVVLYVCGLGYSAVTVNGAPVPNVPLTTAPWTNNARINAISSLDITASTPVILQYRHPLSPAPRVRRYPGMGDVGRTDQLAVVV